MSALPHTLLEHLSAALSSFPGEQHFSLQVVRSQPRRSHALFPHATDTKTKVWQEEVLVILSQQLEVPVLSRAAQAQADSKPAAGVSATPANSVVEVVLDSAANTIPAAADETATAASALAEGAPAAAGPVATRLAGIPVCAIEASIYTIPSTRTALLYVSKVDTTGLGTSALSPTRTLVSAFLAYHLLYPPHGSTRLRAHIFAKSQGQYLFPGSVENPTKKVADDKALMRWWKQTISLAATDPAVIAAGAMAKPDLFYLVPGYSYLDSLPYLPDNQQSEPRWTYGHPYTKIGSPLDLPGAALSTVPPPITDLIPAFPDDPKARFLTSLGSSSIASSGTEGDYDDVMLGLSSAAFTTGQTSAQKAQEVEHTRERERARMVANVQGGPDEFWVLMEARQECCSGALVGFFVLARGERGREQTGGAAEGWAAAEATDGKRPTKVAGSLPHRLFTTLWSQFHNVDYAKAALGKLALAADKWTADVKRVVHLEEGAPVAVAQAECAEGQNGVEVASSDRQGVYGREVHREVVTRNAAWEPRKREAVEAPKAVNMLAPRKKKPKI